jgi:hypothetical protein
MNKELARYFVKLIAEDLQFSFNGMGIPSYSCEWLENQLIQGNYDEVEEFIKKRYDEHENSAKDTNVRGKKRKRKFRAITNGEICGKWKEIHTFCRIGEVECPFFGVVDCRPRDFKAKPFQTKDGKYILIEVKE